MFTPKRLVVIIMVLVGILSVPSSVTAQETGHWWHNIEARVTVCKEEFLLGEPISIKVVVTNHHSETVHLSDCIYRSFEFFAHDSSGRLVKRLRGPGISGLFPVVPVRPRADFNDVVFMNEYLDFPGPGIYTVTYLGYIHVHKGTGINQNMKVQAIPLSSVVSVKLRQGSSSELETALSQYLKQLKSRDNRLQRQAAHALSVSEPVLAVKLLGEALEGENGSYPLGATYATWALAKIGTEPAIQALLNVATPPNNIIARIDAIRELGRWHIKRAVPTLIALLSDPSAKIRIGALRSLGDIGDKSCISEVELRFNDPDEKVRATAKKVYKKLTKDEK